MFRKREGDFGVSSTRVASLPTGRSPTPIWNHLIPARKNFLAFAATWAQLPPYRAAIEALLILPNPFLQKALFPCLPEQAAHSMGTDPLWSVLDPNCKAHDLDNLYIADASCFVSASAVNPSLTIIANAIRVAEHLLSERLK